MDTNSNGLMNQLIEIQEIKRLREFDDLTGFLEIMVYLHKFERGNISNFIKDLRMNQQPVYRTLGKILDLGFVATRLETPEGRKNYESKFYYLTENGQKIAEHIVKMFEVYRKL